MEVDWVQFEAWVDDWEALWRDGWDGCLGIAYFNSVLRAPSVLIMSEEEWKPPIKSTFQAI